jgi:hypothetical protein
MAIYDATVDGNVRLSFEADFAQASSPIEIVRENGWHVSTPFQVADSGHSPRRAADLLNGWCHSEGGAAWEDDECAEVTCRAETETI